MRPSRPPISNDGRVAHGAQHGYSREPLYAVWRGMLSRCYYQKHNRYHRYGGRGITVCEQWWEYPTFRVWALSHGYAKSLTIDRVDSDGPYSPKNCRWVPPQKNQRNRLNNRTLYAFGEGKVLADWPDDPRCVVPYKVLWERLQDGWDPEEALTKPQRRKGGYRVIEAFGDAKSLSEWSKDSRCSVTVPTLWKRINDGWSPERAITAPARHR